MFFLSLTVFVCVFIYFIFIFLLWIILKLEWENQEANETKNNKLFVFLLYVDHFCREICEFTTYSVDFLHLAFDVSYFWLFNVHTFFFGCEQNNLVSKPYDLKHFTITKMDKETKKVPEEVRNENNGSLRIVYRTQCTLNRQFGVLCISFVLSSISSPSKIIDELRL